MKIFEEPIVEITVFEVEDIIAASSDNAGLFGLLKDQTPWG